MNTLVVCPKCEKLNRVDSDKASQAGPICGSCKTDLPLHDHVQDISFTSLTKLLRSSDKPVIVDFWAEWCGPCKVFSPIFKIAAQELSAQMLFAKINTETFPQASQTFKIRGIPTLIVFKGGVEVDRQSGAMPLPALKQYIAKWR